MRTTPALFRSRSIRGKRQAPVSLVSSGSPLSSRQATCSRGVALIIALLILTLMSILGLGLVLSVSSDVLINGYYGSYRASYYGADAGLKVARQYMANQIVNNVSSAACLSWGSTAGGGCAAFPISNPTTLASSVQSTLLSTFGASFVPLSGSSTAVTSTNAKGAMAASFKLSAASVILTAPVSGQCAVGSSNCTYLYQYTLTTLGKGPGTQQVKDTETGYFQVAVTASSGGTTPLFSYFGAFINGFTLNQGQLVSGTLTGPQFTNGSWNFGTNGSYTFTDPVGQHGAKIGYDFSDGWIDSTATSYKHNNTTIAPNFEQGITLNMPAAPMPANDFGQSWAVLDGVGCGETGGSNCAAPTNSPTAANFNSYNGTTMQNASGTVYPTTAPSSGVYLPVSGSISAGTATLTGGGIYVQGTATSVTLTPGASAGIETYTILQGNTVTVVTTNIPANQTTIGTCSTGSGCSATTTSISGAKTISGVPHSSLAGSSNNNAQTILYVNGDIGTGSGNNPTGLQGPAAAATSETAPAIQNGIQLSVVAYGNINVVTNLLYEQEPVTTNSTTVVNGVTVPIDTAVANMSSQTQVLGIFASGNCAGGQGSCGILGLSSPYQDNNLEIDGAIAMVGNNCTSNSCGLETINQINNLTIVGGRAEAFAHTVSINQSNTYYDRRFPTGFGPPFFPSTTVDTGTPTAPTITPTFQRLTWSTSPQN